MSFPVLAICNFIPETASLRRLADRHGFTGVDWTFKPEDIPRNGLDAERALRRISELKGLEIRYHCAFKGIDLGDEDNDKADAAMDAFQRICRLIARLEGRFMTVHLGLGRRPLEELSWERTLSALAELVSYARSLGIRLCLENLAAGWSSRPQLFEKMIRKSGAGITLDIGHARVCQSVRCQSFELEDFVLPHSDRVFNAHIYHEEIDDRHVPPRCLEDILERLDLLCGLRCNWWVLELREEDPLLETLKIVRRYMEEGYLEDARSRIDLRGQAEVMDGR